jgi:hypothetical protein
MKEGEGSIHDEAERIVQEYAMRKTENAMRRVDILRRRGMKGQELRTSHTYRDAEKWHDYIVGDDDE